MKVFADGLQVCDVIYVSYQEKEKKAYIEHCITMGKVWQEGIDWDFGTDFKYFYILNK